MLHPYQSKEYFTYKREINSRLEWLVKHEKYLEALFLYSAAVELELDNAIELSESWTAHILKSKGISFRMSEFRAGQFSRGMTLGNKHRYFKVYLSDKRKRDVELDEWLGKFITLRNKASHDLSKRDLTRLEEEIKSSKINIEAKLLVRLRTKRRAIQEKIRRSNGQRRRYGKSPLESS